MKHKESKAHESFESKEYEAKENNKEGKDKQISFSKSKGSAPNSDKSVSRSCGGSPSKHGMKRGTGQKGNKFTADSSPGA